MPTRKQRRRRQKELRHDYEYVYVDDEGREVEVDPAELEAASPRRNGKRETKATPAKGRNAKAIREVQPPSWNRVLKRVLFIAPLLFLAFSALNNDQSVANRLLITAVYTGFFAPFMYLMDRALYRSYLRRSGQELPARPSRKR
jgi:hypothetical protein